MVNNNTNTQYNDNNSQTNEKKSNSLAIKLTNIAVGWQTSQRNKRLLSNSSNSQPDSPTSPPIHKNKLFRTTNRFEAFAQNENENKPEDPVDDKMLEHDVVHFRFYQHY
jgi:hypothetical protein